MLETEPRISLRPFQGQGGDMARFPALYGMYKELGAGVFCTWSIV